MIKNIIFDVGGVLLEWNPTKFLQELALPSQLEEVFGSLLWGAHDGGLFSRQEVIEKLPGHIDRELFSSCTAQLARQLHPIPEMIELFHEVKRKGYRVFILSNMPEEMHQELLALHDFLSSADGQIFSYQVKAIKPQPQIYTALLNTYNLAPEESLFIDDRLDNLEAAEKLGIQTIHCDDPAKVLSKFTQLVANPQ